MNAPDLEVEKPRLSSSSSQEQSEPAPEPEPKAAPEPEPEPAPKPEPEPEPEPKETATADKGSAEKSEAQSEDDEQGRLLRAYTSNALKLTYLNTQYPRRAMDFKQEGLVVLKVTINRKGDVEDISEETRSKHNLLNRAARQAVNETEPYPEVPKGLKGDTIELTMPFQFRL